MSDDTGSQDITEKFGHVDIKYLDRLAQRVAENKRRAYARMQMRPGARVLDVGCGPATDTLALAEIVGPSGWVVGVDHDPAMIASAQQRAQEAGIEQWTLHMVADAAQLPFGDDHFDAVHAERVFQHLPDTEKVLSEMMRVTRVGGRVVVAEGDWGTISIASEDVDVERRYVRLWADSLANGYIGRRLKGLFARQGLTDIAVDSTAGQITDLRFARASFMMEKLDAMAVRQGVLSADEITRWHKSLEDADARGTFLMNFVALLVSGTKTRD